MCGLETVNEQQGPGDETIHMKNYKTILLSIIELQNMFLYYLVTPDENTTLSHFQQDLDLQLMINW